MTPEEQARGLIRACRGRMHDLKSLRVVGLYLRTAGNADLFRHRLAVEFPGLDGEMVADTMQYFYADSQALSTDDQEALEPHAEAEEGSE